MFGFFVAPIDDNLDNVVNNMNIETQDWTMKAARGECGWICSDCGASFSGGMPDECAYGDQRCNAIIKRDKTDALKLFGDNK